MSDEYHPREHDHLVEPVFGGLGVESPARAQRPGFWRRLWRGLLRWLRAQLRP
ncbi:MAG: hypothetical protein HOP15_05365 [Planctomycetes bacterium]|nr:hypothetical protein [Planctomycetota bacterium]